MAPSLFLPLLSVHSQGSTSPSVFLEASLLPSGGGFDITEKSDYRRYVDGRSMGYIYRESRGHFRSRSGATPVAAAWEGEFYILEESIKDESMSARKVARTVQLDLSSVRDTLAFQKDGGFPSLRGLLAGMPGQLLPGDSWISQASLAVDPKNTGGFLLLPVLVEYKYGGPSVYGGAAVLIVKAKFALRYGLTSSFPAGDSDLRQASGTHDLDIYLDASSGQLVFVRDRFDESYAFASGPAERHAGFTLVFYGPSLRGDRTATLAAIAGGPPPAPSSSVPALPPGTSSASASPPPGAAPPTVPSAAQAGGGSLPSTSAAGRSGPGPLIAGSGNALDEAAPLSKIGVDVLDTPLGVVLRIKDLQFVADSDELLPEAKLRLDEIAVTLSRLPGRGFLVEGHSAGVGRPEGELSLSEKRAHRVVDELVARGIPASRFTWRGLGSTRPIGPNDTEAGRARNRRVEITLLE